MEDRLKPGDRVRFREAPLREGTVSRVGWDGAWGQQLMVEVKWDTGGFGGPFVRDLVRIEEPRQGQRLKSPWAYPPKPTDNLEHRPSKPVDCT
jgi:hypothetical protein